MNSGCVLQEEFNYIWNYISLSASNYTLIDSLCTNRNVLWEEVVAVGAVVEHHLVEGGCGQLHHLAVVVPGVSVFADHPLPDGQLPHGRHVALGTETERLLLTAYHYTA